MEDNIAERVVKLEADNKNIFHQLTEIKEDVRDIRQLTAAVEKIAVKTDETAKKLDGISERIEAVERLPAEDMRYYRRMAVSCIITGVIGTVLGAVLALILN